MRRLRVVAMAGGCAVGSCWGQQQSSEPIDLCTVVTNIQAYNGREVRVTAFLGTGAEQAVLYDPKCRNGEPLVYVSFKLKVTGQKKALRRIIEKKRYALVTIEGTMHGPGPLNVDPKLQDWLKDRFKGATLRYGHLDSMEMMVEVTKIVVAKDVDDGLTSKAGSSVIEPGRELKHGVVADVR